VLKILSAQAIFIGMWFGELKNLKWEQLDLSRGSITVKNDKSFSTKN